MHRKSIPYKNEKARITPRLFSLIYVYEIIPSAPFQKIDIHLK